MRRAGIRAVRTENEGSPLPPEGEGQGEGINLRALHHQSSDAQRVLWRHLRARRLMGYNFRRQVVIEPCIVDFACLEAGLIIEADGGQHSDRVACDPRRTMQLEGMAYRVMRCPSPGGEEVRMHCQPANFPEEPTLIVIVVTEITFLIKGNTSTNYRSVRITSRTFWR
jgi:very-short-patch-repair endonuclease